MTLLGNGLARVLLIISLVVCAVLIFLNIFLGGKINRLAPEYLDRFSKQSGFTLRVNKAGLDPLFRIRLDGLNAADPAAPDKPLAEIETLTIDPRIFSSLLSRSVKIGEIIIDRPVVRYDGKSAGRIIAMIREGEGGDKGSQVEIGRIRLKDARFEVGPGSAFTSGAMDIRIAGERSWNGSSIRIGGDVTVFGKGMSVEGSLDLKPGETSGKFNIETDKFQVGSPPGPSDPARNLKGILELSFTAAENVRSRGELTVLSDDEGSGTGRGALGTLKYELTYDKAEDAAHVSALNFDMMNVLHGSLSGDVKSVTENPEFYLHGTALSSDLKLLSKLVPEIKADTITGNLRSDNLSVSGSIGKNSVELTGGVALDGIGFAFSDDSLRIAGIRCALDIKQGIGGGYGLSFVSRGPCSVEKLSQKDLGEVNGISAGVEIKGSDLWKSKELLFPGLNGGYMDGVVSGSLGLSVINGRSKVVGSLTGANLNLNKAPKSLVPFDLEGSARSLSAVIEGNPGDYKAGVSFAVNNLIVRSSTGREFKVSQAGSSGPLDLEYVEKATDEGKEAKRKIKINGKGLSYESLSFGEYFIEGGNVDDLSFSLDIGGDWALSMASQGKGFQVPGRDINLEQFKEHIEIEKSGRRGFSGTINGTGGRFKSVAFPELSAEYVFGGDFLDMRKLSAGVSSIGELRTDDLRVEFGAGKGGYPYTIKLNDGVFSGYEDKLRSEGISGTFVVNDPETSKTEWEGTASALKTDIFSQVVESLHFTASPSPDGILLKDITGKLLNGEVKGRVDIVTSGTPARIITDIGLKNASVKSGDLDIALGSADFAFSGTVPDDSLPEGTGKLEFDGLNLKKPGMDVVYSGSVNSRTSGETLFIEDGFIRDKDKSELRFLGEMGNSLSADRRLEVVFPDFALASAVKFLSPLMPVTIKEGQVSGTASFNVVFNRVFDAGSSWSGGLSFKGASFAAYIGGADLSLRGINGSITVKDEGKGGNALASLVGNALTLDKEVYKEYLRSFKEPAPDTEADHIKIDGIEYGILKFENVECALEADGGKIGIIKLAAGFFGGELYSSGVLNLGGAESVYNFSFLFNDISLDAISKRLSPSEEYITGRLNGLVWLTGDGGDLNTIDGPFEFWSISSAKEPRSIGKALLDKLGAKERLILGSSRSYDNGEISGYINDGIITFKKFNISNSILGIRNLSIQADPVKNSISIAHLVSVIREIARRSQSGGPTIETQ